MYMYMHVHVHVHLYMYTYILHSPSLHLDACDPVVNYVTNRSVTIERYSYMIFVGFFSSIEVFSRSSVLLVPKFVSRQIGYDLYIILFFVKKFCYFRDCRAYIIKSGHRPGGTSMASHMIG